MTNWDEVIECMASLIKSQETLIKKIEAVIEYAETLVVQEELRNFENAEKGI